jgi:hypothetical protein
MAGSTSPRSRRTPPWCLSACCLRPNRYPHPHAGANARWHLTLVDALQHIQRHTVQRVTVPNVDAMTPDQLAALRRTGRLLRGEQIETTWTAVTLTVGTPDSLPPGDQQFSLMSATQLIVDLDGQEIPLPMTRPVLYEAARVGSPEDIQGAVAGDTITLVPGATARAIIAVVPAEDDPIE